MLNMMILDYFQLTSEALNQYISTNFKGLIRVAESTDNINKFRLSVFVQKPHILLFDLDYDKLDTHDVTNLILDIGYCYEDHLPIILLMYSGDIARNGLLDSIDELYDERICYIEKPFDKTKMCYCLLRSLLDRKRGCFIRSHGKCSYYNVGW